jgi:hypothetical protein
MFDNEPPDEVGYGKPPKSGMFKKGQSGNPKRRPKGSKNLATVVLRESRQVVRVNSPRGTRTVTKLEAAVMQLGNKAAQGDLRSQRELLSQVRMAEEVSNSVVPPQTSHEIDQKIMENLRRRMEKITAEATSTKSEPEKEKSE